MRGRARELMHDGTGDGEMVREGEGRDWVRERRGATGTGESVTEASANGSTSLGRRVWESLWTFGTD